VFILRRVFLVDFFEQEEGEGPNTPRDLNTLQEESNKFEVRTWNSKGAQGADLKPKKNLGCLAPFFSST
jgi:hypothetical protein